MRTTLKTFLPLISKRSYIKRDSSSVVEKLRAVDGHLPLAHTLWSQIVRKGDTVIDATCGNGGDSLVLSKLALTSESGFLYCLDIQDIAVQQTKKNLVAEYGCKFVDERVELTLCDHRNFPEQIKPETVTAIVYNLGYLPGTSEQGVDRIMTTLDGTIQSFERALPLLKIGGILTATAYRGHSEGFLETEACLDYFSKLSQVKWRVFAHSPLNTLRGPILISVCRK